MRSVFLLAPALLAGCQAVNPPTAVGCELPPPPGPAHVVADVASVDFGATDEAITRTVNVSNTGDHTTAIREISVMAGDAFSATADPPKALRPRRDDLVAILEPGETLPIDITFEPSSGVSMGVVVVETGGSSRDKAYMDPLNQYLEIPVSGGRSGEAAPAEMFMSWTLSPERVTEGQESCATLRAWSSSASVDCYMYHAEDRPFYGFGHAIDVGEHTFREFRFNIGADVAVPEGEPDLTMQYTAVCYDAHEDALWTKIRLLVYPQTQTWEDYY